KDADPSLIQAKKVAIIGFGSQGHAHALNLHNSGIEVTVGLREGSSSREQAEAEGLRVESMGDAAEWADVIMLLVPDQHMGDLYRAEIEPRISEGDTLMFAHGFNIHFGEIIP